MLDAQEVVDDLEPLGPGGDVDTAKVHDLLVLGVGVVAEEAHDGNDAGRRDVERQLVLVDRRLLDEFGESCHQESAKLLESGRDRLEVVGGVAPSGLGEGGLLARGSGGGSERGGGEGARGDGGGSEGDGTDGVGAGAGE